MKFNFSRLMPLSLMLAMLMALVPVASVYAADLISISPSTIVNNIANTITVTGTGFDNTAVVLLDGSTLSTAL